MNKQLCCLPPTDIQCQVLKPVYTGANDGIAAYLPAMLVWPAREVAHWHVLSPTLR